jgi:HD superfamily phosphohydrolase
VHAACTTLSVHTHAYRLFRAFFGATLCSPAVALTRAPHAPPVAVDTPEFQRLRDLKQLGLTYLVFPGASHNRFEHSLGTAHLGASVFAHLFRLQRADLEADAADGNVVALAVRLRWRLWLRGVPGLARMFRLFTRSLTHAQNAPAAASPPPQGLCHDLGHGPFSHVFDTEFLPRRFGSSYDPDAWSHEGMSADMLEYLVDQNHIDTASHGGTDLVRRVQSLITSGHRRASLGAAAETSGGGGAKRGYLREIVANARNSVDVDKFDYIQRDCQNCGLKNSADFTRLQLYMKVIDDEICFKASEVLNLYELFHTRASLHQRVYTHRKAKAIEYMVVDALVAADDAWGSEISNAIWAPKSFAKLDDSILKRIEWSDEPGLRGAQEVLRRLRRRELYKYVNEFTVPRARLRAYVDVTPADITTCQAGGLPGGLRPEDIIVQNLRIDWAMKSNNPVDHIHFYQDYDSTEKFSIPKEKVSSLIPDVFMERKVRVFSKSDDPAVVAAVEAAFIAYQRREYHAETQARPGCCVCGVSCAWRAQIRPRGEWSPECECS